MSSNKNFTFLNVKQGMLWVSIMILISIISLGYIGIWGYSNNNIQAGFVVIIFGFLLTISLIVMLVSIIVSQLKTGTDGDFWLNNWVVPSSLFYAGFVIQASIVYFGTKKAGYSLLSIGKNALLSTFSSNMPRFAEFFINAIMVPIIEELFFVFFIPQALIWIMDAIGFKIDIFKNKILQLVTIIIISASLFAIFHVGQQGNIDFIIAAIIFRTVTILAIWGDVFFDWFKYAVVGVSFTIGFHIANNWFTYGFWNGVQIMISNVWGIMFLILFALMFLFGPLELFLRAIGVKKSL